MKISRRGMMTILVGALPVLGFAQAANAGTTINVSLWDKGPMSMDMMGKGEPMGMAMKGAGMMNMAMMGITPDPTEVAAGEVTFAVTNDSKDIIHEMIVARVEDPNVMLPYLLDENRVDEEATAHLGEVAELDPGKSGSLTVTLKPGSYILYCNVPGHYVLGMWTLVKVTE